MAQDTTMNFQFTQLGVDLATKALAGTTKITFTKAVTSSENHFSDTEATALALTTLGEVQQTIEIKTVMAVTDNKAQVKVPVVIDRGAITTDYSLLSIGLYAKDDDGTEVLYAVNGLQDAVEMRANAFNSTYSIDLYVAVGTSDNVTLTVDAAGMLPRTEFTAVMAEYMKIADMPKDLAYTDKANTFTEQQTLAGGAVDGTGNAIATTKDVSDGDVETLTSAKAYVDTKVSGKADDSKVVHTTDTSSWQKSKVTDDTGMPLLMLGDTDDLSAKINELPTGYFTIYCTDKTLNNPSAYPKRGTIHVTASGFAGSGILFSEDKNTYVITMLNGTVTYTQLAFDSKVAHLSGANNFDTVPTVNNNPLLLASSLPSDLARTGQDVNFTGKLQKSGQDVATTDDLTIVYAGVPSLSFDGSGNYTITASKNADIAHITDYTLYYRVKGTGDFTQVALTPDNLTGTVDLSKVTTATNFESYATATNVFGESDPSSMVQWSYDPEKASSTPPSLTIADDGTYTITVPTSTPTPIVKYFLYYNVDGQSDTTKLDVGTQLTGSLKELITKPDKTTIYDVQATAMNANAESGVSNSIQFTYVPIDESIYGASWNRKSSPTLTRTDAAVGLNAGINGAQNDFDNVGPWKGMHRVTDSMGNVFVRIPKFYIRKTQTGSPDNGTATWQVSLVSHGDDWYLPKGFWDFTNSKELDYIDIGAYDATGSSSKLTSVAGQAPLVNLSIANFRSAAKANGTGYQIWDIHANDMLQVLFIIEFATLNSQSVMEGVDNGTSAAKSGAADSHKGSSGTAGSGSSAMSYRGIENLYGNVWQFCDGVNFEDNQPWVCEDATKFQSDLFASPYVRTSYTATSRGSNHIKTLGFDSLRPYVQFVTDDSGSNLTYYADYDWRGSGNTILETGGNWDDGAGVGLFRSARNESSTIAGAIDGSRLLKKALS